MPAFFESQRLQLWHCKDLVNACVGDIGGSNRQLLEIRQSGDDINGCIRHSWNAPNVEQFERLKRCGVLQAFIAQRTEFMQNRVASVWGGSVNERGCLIVHVGQIAQRQSLKFQALESENPSLPNPWQRKISTGKAFQLGDVHTRLAGDLEVLDQQIIKLCGPARYSMPISDATLLRCFRAVSFGSFETISRVMSPASMLPRKSIARSSGILANDVC